MAGTRQVTALALLLAASGPAPVVVDLAALDRSDEAITVAGSNRPLRIEGDALEAAERVFARDRARFAPQARLLWQVTLDGDESLAPLVLGLIGSARQVALGPDAAGRFALPERADGERWRMLVGNRSRTVLSVLPLVVSPGHEGAARRLGDLRLECRVAWALLADDPAWTARKLPRSPESCGRANVTVGFRAAWPVGRATLSEGARTVAVPLAGDAVHVRPPIADARWGNEAIVTLEREP